MGSSIRSFGRQRSVHEILGGGIIADVMLWRRRHITVGILLGTLAAWLVFETSGYTLLSLVSNVLLLSICILFGWAKAAQILNRPPPPIPELHLSEEAVNEAALFLRCQVNTVLSVSRDIALGKDSKLFYKVAVFLCLISILGSWTDLLTFGYTSIVTALTIPVLYEKYEGNIDSYMMLAHAKARRVCERADAACFTEAKRWVLGQKKLS